MTKTRTSPAINDRADPADNDGADPADNVGAAEAHEDESPEAQTKTPTYFEGPEQMGKQSIIGRKCTPGTEWVSKALSAG